MGRSPESPYSCPTPIEQAQEACEDNDLIAVTQLATRRKSSTWKGLKRQLSKVDLKLKNPLKEKRHSIFYSGVLPGIVDNIDQVEEDVENMSSQDSGEDVTVVRSFILLKGGNSCRKKRFLQTNEKGYNVEQKLFELLSF